jgi:hypothetical protein
MREFDFIRRFLELNTAEQSFSIKRETRYNIEADSYESAVTILVKQIDNAEGQEGVLVNNGFPAHCVTSDSQAFYLALHSMSAYIHQMDDACSVGCFRKQLAQSDDYEEAGIYQGFYADNQLFCPRALTSHRLQCRGDEFNYLFDTEGGCYQGEYDKYLWYDKVLYKGIGLENSENKPVSENV